MIVLGKNGRQERKITLMRWFSRRSKLEGYTFEYAVQLTAELSNTNAVTGNVSSADPSTHGSFTVRSVEFVDCYFGREIVDNTYFHDCTFTDCIFWPDRVD